MLPNRESILSSENYDLISSDSPAFYDVQMQQSTKESDHPILELDEVNILNFAPVQSSINAFNNYPDALSLFVSRYQNISTNSPVISVLEQGNLRRSEFNAAGWFKMYLSPNKSERLFIEQLVLNLVDWTSSNPDNRLLKIKTSKNAYSTSELPLINASLLNENGGIESKGVIEVTITGDDYTANYTMDNLGNGNYQLQVQNLPNGKYEFSAVARKGNREIDSQNGEFLVSESSIELANTIRNDDLLANIASNSGGVFLDHSSSDEIWNSDDINSSLIERNEIIEDYIFPVKSIYWFILVLFLLGAEWLSRKRFALP